MSGPALVRIDDRLIHGQVVVSWFSQIKFSRVIIVDDEVAMDSFLTEVVQLAAPSDIEVKILSIKEAVSDLSFFKGAFVLVKNPLTCLALTKAGLFYDKLIIGGMGARPGRKMLYRNISASEMELQALNELAKMGIRSVFQILASDRPVAYKLESK